jgi:hypothetical protein
MFRIDGITAAPALPAPSPVSGTPGYFTGGDPVAMVPPTIVSPDFLNMIQEELANVVEAAGMTLTKTSFNQLLLAIETIITNAMPYASDAEAIAGVVNRKVLSPHSGAALVTDRINALINSAPGALDTLKELADALGDDPNFATTVNTALAARALASRQITGGGLVSGGGDLSADRQLIVLIASGAELNAGTANDKALTPASYAAGGGGTWDRGWTTLPGGFIKQWATETVSASGTSTIAGNVVFPVPFTQGCGWIGGNADDGAGANHPAVTVTFPISTKTGSSFKMDSTAPDQPFTVNRILRWSAVGK